MLVARQDLERLHENSDGVFWIRYLVNKEDHGQKSFSIDQLDEALKYLEDHGRANRYVSISSFPDGASKTSENAITCHTLPADFDCPADYRNTKNQPFATVDETITQVTSKLKKIGLEPTIIKTGGGIQIRINISDNLAQCSDIEFSSLSEAVFQAGLPSDKRGNYYNETKNKANFIRLPGLLNIKANKMAEVHHYSDEVYTLDEVKQKLGLTELQAAKELSKPSRFEKVKVSELPADWLEWARSDSLQKLNQTEAYSSSSEKEMAIQAYLYRHGITDTEQQLVFFKDNVHKSSHFMSYGNDEARKTYLDRGLQKIAANTQVDQEYYWHDPISNKVDVNKLIAWFDQNRKIFLDDFRLFDQTLRMWDGRKWVVSSDSTLEKYFFGFFQERGIAIRRNHVKELCSSFKLYVFYHVRIEDREIDYTRKIAIAFSNGTLYTYPDKMEHDFRDHFWDKLDYSLYQIDHAYDEDLMTLDWHHTMVGDHLNEFYTKEGSEAIQLFFASVMIPQFDLQKCLYILGSGCNGKGMITRTFTSLFSNGAVTSLNVSKWGVTHENIVLKDSVLNISNEIKNRDLASDTFKAVVACDYITFNPKFETPFQVKLFAKHIFTANDLPNTGVDKALARRLLFVKSIKSVPMNEQSSHYEVNYRKSGQRVWLAIALQGIYKLISRGFKINGGDEECKFDWIEENDSLYEFIQETFDQGRPDDFISTKDVCQLYLTWKDQNRMHDVIRNMTPNKMGKRLQKIMDALEWKCVAGRKRFNEKQVRGWYVLKLKPKRPDLEVVRTNG